MRIVLCKLLTLVVIFVGCHIAWNTVRDNNLKRKFLEPSTITSIYQLSVGEPLVINIKGIVTYTDKKDLAIIEYRDSSGNPQQLVFRVMQYHNK